MFEPSELTKYLIKRAKEDGILESHSPSEGTEVLNKLG